MARLLWETDFYMSGLEIHTHEFILSLLVSLGQDKPCEQAVISGLRWINGGVWFKLGIIFEALRTCRRHPSLQSPPEIRRNELLSRYLCAILEADREEGSALFLILMKTLRSCSFYP